jgi:putative phosphoesterase
VCANGNIARQIVNETAPSTVILQNCRRLGVLSDTHIPHRLQEMPPRVYALLQGSDVILHAGDLEEPNILTPLCKIAPTYAVRGNLHWQFSTGTHDQNLPLSLTFNAGQHVIWMTHGHISFAHSVVDKALGIGQRRSLSRVNRHLIERLSRMKPPKATIVIFGHSHLSCAVRFDGALYFNPGAVASSAERRPKEPPRVGRLTLREDGYVDYEWSDL